jgi:transcriptional regulator with XRE-family HTH domain
MQHEHKKFAELLRERLDRKNLNSAQLADIIGVNRCTTDRWVKGKNTPQRGGNIRKKLLRCIKPLDFQYVTEFNQFLEAAGQPVLNDAEQQKYFPHSKFELPPPPQLATSSNNEECQEHEYPINNKLAGVIFIDYIKGLFLKLSQLNPYPIMLLLTQAHWDEPPCRDAILARARQLYSDANVLHIHPPVSLSVDSESYFADLGKQCGMECVKKEYDFEKLLKARVEKTDCLFLLVSCFEQGVPSLGKQLASMIRNISETYPYKFHVVLCGGNKLAALKYKYGHLSLLNIATVEHWPELGRAEVKALGEHRFELLDLDDATADDLLEVSGGHPQLLNECLKLQKQNPLLNPTDFVEELTQCDALWQSFLPFDKDQQARQTICEWLKQDKLAYWQPYIQNELLRELYWKNLLVKRDNNGKQGLEWRCDAVRMAGKRILKCG